MERIDVSGHSTEAAAGLRSLLEDVVDYAGMFPPAGLPLSSAIEHYARHRTSEERWMLARFVCSVRHLQALDAHADLFDEQLPFRFSVLPSGGDAVNPFLEAFERDLEEVQRFESFHPNRVRVEQVEMRLPRSLLDTDAVTVRRFLNALDAAAERHEMSSLHVFLEIPLDENLRQTLPLLTGAAAARNRDRAEAGVGRMGVKMRTGGTEADAFPGLEPVAAAITTCVDAGSPFKATAGLHHPFRRYDETIGTEMHGFLNVFLASVFAFAHALDERRVTDMLAERDVDRFRFTDSGIGWSDLQADVNVIRRARRDGAISFGSCSFQEPVDHLRDLGLL